MTDLCAGSNLRLHSITKRTQPVQVHRTWFPPNTQYANFSASFAIREGKGCCPNSILRQDRTGQIARWKSQSAPQRNTLIRCSVSTSIPIMSFQIQELFLFPNRDLRIFSEIPHHNLQLIFRNGLMSERSGQSNLVAEPAQSNPLPKITFTEFS